MPKVVRLDFGEAFDRVRDELAPRARGLVNANQQGFREAGAALDADYPVAAERERLRARLAANRAARAGVMDVGEISAAGRSGGAPADQHAGGWKPLATFSAGPHWGDQLRGARLNHAIDDFLTKNRKGELLRALGNNLPAGEREANARRAILLGLAAVDPDATTYLGDLTDLAKAPWVAPARPPLVSRSDVCREYHEHNGHRCLELLREALAVLLPSGAPAATATRRIAWPHYPLSPVTTVRDTFRLTFDQPEGALFTYEVDDGIPIQGPRYAVYVPTTVDLEILNRAYPNGDSENPSWATIEADLIAGGQAPRALRGLSAPTLLRLLQGPAASRVSETTSRTITGTAPPRTARTTMCRVVGHQGALLSPDAVLKLEYRVRDVTTPGGEHEVASAVIPVCEALLPELVVDERWTKDRVGFNFRHTLSADHFPAGSRRYWVKYLLQLHAGEPIVVECDYATTPSRETVEDYPDVEFKPTRWYKDQFGVDAARLRQASRRGRLPMRTIAGQVCYHVPTCQTIMATAMKPESVTPASTDRAASKPAGANEGSWAGQALALRHDHPDWSIKRIARKLGISAGSVFRRAQQNETFANGMGITPRKRKPRGESRSVRPGWKDGKSGDLDAIAPESYTPHDAVLDLEQRLRRADKGRPE